MVKKNIGLCNQCRARVPAEFFTKDAQGAGRELRRGSQITPQSQKLPSPARTPAGWRSVARPPTLRVPDRVDLPRDGLSSNFLPGVVLVASASVCRINPLMFEPS
jgi:hypothetical protein